MTPICPSCARPFADHTDDQALECYAKWLDLVAHYEAERHRRAPALERERHVRAIKYPKGRT